LIDQFDRAEPVTTINYSPRRFALAETAKLIEQVVHGSPGASDAEPWRLITDSLTGTLVVTTTPARHQEIERLLERLESMAQSSKRPIRSYAIKNRSVEELQGLLQGLLDAGALKGPPPAAAPATPDSPAQQGVTAPLANAPLPTLKSDDLGDKVIITIDRPTNRLIAMGESRVLEQLESLIAELDVRQPQVLVEAMVVTLTDSQTRSLGIEMQKRGVQGDIQYQLSSLFGLGSPDPAFGSLLPAAGTGFGGVVLDPGNFSAVVRALETVNEGRSLAMPKMLVDNNQAASLDSVLQTPFSSTNASTTVATTSFGGTLDAGTQIQVTPQIASGGQLLLDYSISLSSFTGVPSDPSLPPPRQQNKLKSVATVPDGYTVVVGGLELTTDSNMRSSVPFLGDLPLIGFLFGTQSKSENRARFFVFLRCNVMRASGFGDLKYASQKDLADAAVDDGQPKLKPRIMR
jgi:general secretion pathway protein D